LVTKSESNENLVFVVPGNFELNLKKAAKASSSKNVELIKLKELMPLTGYIHGGCSPVGMKKLFPTFIDETAQLFDTISVSAGARGIQMIISPSDLAVLIEAKFADLI
jgi:Cys-tRNA(Pro)/Cys-tRNA(Cys) deacylase